MALLTSTSYKLLFLEVHTSVLLQIKLFSRLHIESRDLLFQKPRALQGLKASYPYLDLKQLTLLLPHCPLPH